MNSVNTVHLIGRIGQQPDMRYLETGRDTLVFTFNHRARTQEANIELRLPDGQYRATDIVNGRAVVVTRNQGRIAVQQQIAPHDVWVLKVEPGS